MDVVGDDGVEVDEGGAAHLAEVEQAVQLGGMSFRRERQEWNSEFGSNKLRKKVCWQGFENFRGSA